MEETNLGGVKDATISIKAKGQTEIDDMPFARLKFEAGVHRVQRVPVTESQGRIHTSAAGVLYFPRPKTSRSPSIRTTCALMCIAPRDQVARASTPPTPQCASRTCPQAWSSPARTRNRSCRTRNRRCGSCARVWWRWPRSRRKRRPCHAQGTGAHRRSFGAHSHVQLPGELVVGPPHGLQGVQPRNRPRR